MRADCARQHAAGLGDLSAWSKRRFDLALPARASWRCWAPARSWSVSRAARWLRVTALTFACRRKSAPWPTCRPRMRSGGLHRCLLDLSSGNVVCRRVCGPGQRAACAGLGRFDRRCADAGLLKARQTRDFGIAQLTSSSCIPALNADIPSTPQLPRHQRQGAVAGPANQTPTSCLLHGTWEQAPATMWPRPWSR